MKKIQIITPGNAQGSIHVYLSALVKYSTLRGYDVNIQNPKGSDLCAVRWEGLCRAMQADPDYVQWIDSDMVFPPDAMHRLWLRNQQFVACNCMIKDFRGSTSALKNGESVSSKDKTDLEEVDMVGLGFVLHEAALVRFARPFDLFSQRWIATDSGYVSHYEDAKFCEYLRSTGIQLFVDHDLSKEIGHQGQVVFRHEGVSLG